MPTILLNGLRASTMQMTVPMYGPWSADVELSGDVGPAAGDPATLTIGTLAMVGTVRRAATFAGGYRMRLVGGAGGWRKVIPARSYSHKEGVRFSSVVSDAAREAGETAVIPTDHRLGLNWVRAQGKAERVLKILTGGVWYVDAEGKTQIRDRDSSPIATPFTVVSRDGGRGSFEVATEAYQDWTPGRTFTSPTVADPQVISTVSMAADNEGKLRLTVLTADSDRERMTAAIRAIVRAEMAEALYSGLWEYTVQDFTDTTLGLNLDPRYPTIAGTPTDKRMPSIRDCPVMPGASGQKVAVSIGAKCVVAFVDQDPGKPVCVFVRGSAPEHVMTLEATILLLHNVFGALGLANGIFIGPVIAATIAPAIEAALTAAAVTPIPLTGNHLVDTIALNLESESLASPMVAGAPGNSIGPPLPYEAAILALKEKVANITGHFPSLGLPTRDDY